MASFPGADGAVLCSSAPKSSPDAIRVGPSPKKTPLGLHGAVQGWVCPREAAGDIGDVAAPQFTPHGAGARISSSSSLQCLQLQNLLQNPIFCCFFFFQAACQGQEVAHGGPSCTPKGISQPGEVRGRAPLPAGVSGAPGRLQKEEKPPKKTELRAAERLRCSPPAPVHVRGGEEACPELGFGFIFNLSKPPDNFVATSSEISHRTQTVLGELLPKGGGDTRHPPKKKKKHRGGESSTGTSDPLPASIRLKPTQRFIVCWRGKSRSLPPGNLWLASN